MLRETSVAMTSFKSTWVASDAGTAGVGRLASAAMALTASADFIRPRNIARRKCTLIAFTFFTNPYGKTIQPNLGSGKFSLLGGRGHKRHLRNRIEIGQQGREQPKGWQIRGQDVDEFDAGTVCDPAQRGRAQTRKPEREA